MNEQSQTPRTHKHTFVFDRCTVCGITTQDHISTLEKELGEALANTCDGTGACPDGKCLKCRLVNLQLTNDTLQARVNGLNISLSQAFDDGAMAELFKECLKDQLLLANAQIVVKDEVLKTGQKHWLADHCHNSASRITPFDNALTNSPAAAKELIAKMERMEKALDRLARLGNELFFGNSKGNEIARDALSTTQQSTKE